MTTTSPPTQTAPTAAWFTAPEGAWPPAERLVVLVPQADTNEIELARRIWALAAPRALRVLFLGFCPNTAEELRMRRRLITLAAVTRDDRVPVDAQLAFGSDWIGGVRSVLRAGDIVICHAEQKIGWRRRPLSQALLAAVRAPVCTLFGFYPPMNVSLAAPVAQAITWAVPIAIIAGFFWLQTRIDQLAPDWDHTALFCLSVIVEFGLIAIWHRLSA